jgi:hypothetical protein
MAPNNGIRQHHSGIPSLPTMPSPDGNDNHWSWMIVACLSAGWVAEKGGHETMVAAMVEKSVWRLILLVFCA